MQGDYWWAIVILFITSAISLGLGAIVIQSGRSLRHRWFLTIATSSSVWIATNALFEIATAQLQQSIALLSYGSAVALAVSFLGFAYEFSGVKISKIWSRLYIFVGAVVGVLSMIPGILLLSVTPTNELITNAVSLVAYGSFVASSLLVGLAVLVRGRQLARGRRRRQISTVLTGAVIAAAIGIFCNLIAPLFGNYQLVQIGPIGILVFVVVTAYAVVRHGMFDVRRAVARTSVYTMSFAVLSGLYVVLAYGLSAALFESGSAQHATILSPINVILALVLVFVFQPIKHFFDQLTNRIFYHGEYDRDAFAREFGRILSYDNDLRLLLKEVGLHIANNLKAEQVFFYIVGRGVMGATGSRRSRMLEGDIEQISGYYEQHHVTPEVLMTDAVESREVERILRSYQVSIVLPLEVHRQIIGYVFIGEHKSRGYRARDVRVLESIGNELAIAVQNSLSVEEVRELNESLQHRIDDATRELRLSNKQLQRLDEAKDEFISMASHQLRTPLTSIKGYLDMVLQGDLGKVSSTQRAVLGEAFISSERMVALINDFLNVSRLQTGKFIIERRESDLALAVQEQLQMLEVVAKQHNLSFKQKIAKDLPLLEVDIDKLRQVILNMIDNAIYYSKPGSSIEVSLTKEGSEVVFSVKDTGIGVPESEQVGLFGKFFRASNARKKRPDGTGVGLFLAKKVIVSHGGQIVFSSSEGKGSTFGFRLPIPKRRQTPKIG